MPVIISKIEISNFRSINKLVLTSSRLHIIAGSNDAGKSNILRAINLFFNGKTNPEDYFEFDRDYNIFNEKKKDKKAKEIKIKLTLDIPDSYKKTNGDSIEWTKSWRSTGLYNEIIYGIKKSKGPRGGDINNRIIIPAKSNLRSLLNNIKYIYIPAVKDKEYIAKLRSEIYFVVNSVFNKNFKISSEAFEKSIAENLSELTSEISSSLGFNSEMSLPKDLSSLFGNLDFLNEMKISLNDRGDGIKARHIPLILKYIATKTKTLQERGNPPYTFIWGYEEPENNLELTSAINLAAQFKTFVPDPISQLFVTTHSPAFYNLSKEDSEVNCLYVEKDEEDITHYYDKYDKLDYKMGVMDIISPYIEEVKKQMENMELSKKIDDDKAVIYVEGTSDKMIFDKALELFYPDRKESVEIKTKHEGAGGNYVSDMLIAYYHTHKHHSNMRRCAAIVDADDEGKKAIRRIGEIQDIGKHVKCFKLIPTDDLKNAKRDGYLIPLILESHYPISIWEEQLRNNKLEKRDNLICILDDKKSNELLRSNTSFNEDINDKTYKVKVENQIPSDRKVNVANIIIRLDTESCKDALNFTIPILDDVLNFLFPGSIKEGTNK